MNNSLYFYQACLQIQLLEHEILLAKRKALKDDIPYEPNVNDEQLDLLYQQILGSMPNNSAPRNYRDLSNLAYAYSLADMVRLFNRYGTNITLPDVFVNTPNSSLPPSTTFLDSDVIGWFGSANQLQEIQALQSELSFMTKFVQRYHPNAKEIIKFAVKFKMQLRNCTKLSDALAAIKTLRPVLVKCNVKSFLPIPGGLLKGPVTYWKGMYYQGDVRYTIPYIPIEYKPDEDLMTPCHVLPADGIQDAIKAGRACYGLLKQLANIYNDIKTFRRFDNATIFPLNKDLLEEVLLSPELTEEDRYILLNYTNPGYIYLFFRFFTDAMLRYRRIADAIEILIERSTGEYNGEQVTDQASNA